MEDKVQDRAAAHRGTPFQLQAGPGTGKTRTLVKRVNSLLADDVDPQAILVLTFSNRTAGELSERLAAALPLAKRGIWIWSAGFTTASAFRPILSSSTAATRSPSWRRSSRRSR
jgi:superfamily I DNA/RNA helicase